LSTSGPRHHGPVARRNIEFDTGGRFCMHEKRRMYRGGLECAGRMISTELRSLVEVKGIPTIKVRAWRRYRRLSCLEWPPAILLTRHAGQRCASDYTPSYTSLDYNARFASCYPAYGTRFPLSRIMFARPAQHLTIQSPSSTTVSYTVSNASSSVTTSSKALSYLQGTLRICVCICVFLVNVATADAIFAPRALSALLRLSLIEDAARSIAKVLDWRVTTVLSLVILYLCMRRRYTGATFGLCARNTVMY
jgi:hypothetical protein